MALAVSTDCNRTTPKLPGTQRRWGPAAIFCLAIVYVHWAGIARSEDPPPVAEPAAQSEEQPVPPIKIAQSQDQFRTDTERMSDLEERFNALEGKVKSPKDEKEKKESYPTHKITGFLQLDSAWYAQDALNTATVGDAQDGTGFRRARFAV